jgi:hypothetical protein
MKRNLVRSIFLASALILGLVSRAPAQITSRLVVCPPAVISEGWIKVDVLSSPSTCGGNAWVLETYNNKAVGSAMVVCADQPTPAGWETLHFGTSSGQCGGGGIKAIRRVG